MSYYDPYEYEEALEYPEYKAAEYDDAEQEQEPVDETGTRNTWEIITWIIIALTIILNLVLIAILVLRRNLHSIVNKIIFTVAISDLVYGCIVSPFFVENYVRYNWARSIDYCRFYTYYFTFHDLFAPLCLMALSIYISLKFTGVTAEMKWKRQIYIAISLGIVLFSMVLAIPATVQAGVFQDNPPDGGEFKEECRSWDVYTMIITYSIFSSVLFCLTFSFLFSLCILGSPLLRDVYDPDEHTQRWRLLLTLSLVNIFYIISGFLINFKELSRLMYKCCLVTSLLDDVNNITYDVWNFVLLVGEPMFRPLVWLSFYLAFLLDNDNVF